MLSQAVGLPNMLNLTAVEVSCGRKVPYFGILSCQLRVA